MSRKGNTPQRSVLPDPKHGSETIARFINMVMYSGKKSVAEKIVYGAMDVIGDRALLAPGEPTAPAMGMFGTAYMWSLGVLIAGGAANIQRNIIAERGLGLPRDARR